jgi:hypothetical protein
MRDDEIKKYLDDFMTTHSYCDGFKSIVNEGVVQVKKDDILSSQKFIFEEESSKKKDDLWNINSLKNLIQKWYCENRGICIPINLLES